MTKGEVIKKVGSPILVPLGLIQGVFILMLLVSPFLWIWKDWNIAWKIGLTGIIGTVLIYGIYSVVKGAVKEAVDKQLENTPVLKSKFQERLEKIQEKRNSLKN